jgi:hypothetical protein
MLPPLRIRLRDALPTHLALLIATLLATLATTGCYVNSGGIKVHRSIWERTERDLHERAATYLRCDVSATQLTLLERRGRHPTAVLATGCDRRMVYERRLRRHLGMPTDTNAGDWMMVSHD